MRYTNECARNNKFLKHKQWGAPTVLQNISTHLIRVEKDKFTIHISLMIYKTHLSDYLFNK